MQNPRLATRYAKSLIDLSVEKGQLENVFADMLWLQSVCKTNKDFVTMLKSPIIKSDKKQKIVEAITDGRISEITKGFNRLLIAKGRESNLPEVAAAFVHQYKVHKNIFSVKLTTASQASEELKKAFVDHLKTTTDMQNIELEAVVDQNIIGGFVLQVGDKLVDASIAFDLRHVARQFDNNDFIYKVR